MLHHYFRNAMKQTFLIYLSIFVIFTGLYSCADSTTDVQSDTQSREMNEHSNQSRNIEVQGHRGCRGLFPENSVPGFIHALSLGVDVLEMDVVITKDEQVIVSHEPWINESFCFGPENEELGFDSIVLHNIYQMTFDEVREFDCGSKLFERFPNQRKLRTHKPLLKAVIDSVKTYCRATSTPMPGFNIELKYVDLTDGTFHPDPEKFASLVLAVVEEAEIDEYCTFQSFSVKQLEALHQVHPKNLVYLVENGDSYAENAQLLSFKPAIYSPDFNQLTDADIQLLRQENVKCIPWTINSTSDMKRAIDLGVDGIITDYPDSLLWLLPKLGIDQP